VPDPVWAITKGIKGQARSATHPWQAPDELAITAESFDATKGWGDELLLVKSEDSDGG
jgi:hypothetical protein